MQNRSETLVKACYQDIDLYLAITTAGLPGHHREENRDELRQHLEMLIAAHRTNGTSEQDAVSAALQKFGDPHTVGDEMAREYARQAQEGEGSLWKLLSHALFFPGIVLAAHCGFVLFSAFIVVCGCKNPVLAQFLATFNSLYALIMPAVIAIVLPLMTGFRLRRMGSMRNIRIGAFVAALLFVSQSVLENHFVPGIALLHWSHTALLVYVGLAFGYCIRPIRPPALPTLT